MVKISPSLLACDLANLESEIKKAGAAGADMLHVDVMDGLFVPNISFGQPVVKSIRAKTAMLLDVHLMITNPLRYVDEFAKAGADIITFHIEAADDPGAVIGRITAAGKVAGITLKPGTPVEALAPWLDKVGLVLIMTVEPGFGGQSFMPDMLPKIAYISDYAKRSGREIFIEVDGGIDRSTAALVREAGANLLVAGTAVFGAPDIKEAVEALRG